MASGLTHNKKKGSKGEEGHQKEFKLKMTKEILFYTFWRYISTITDLTFDVYKYVSLPFTHKHPHTQTFVYFFCFLFKTTTGG